ncbi:hypothetical protein D6745_03580 [Candidatus Woesearchaeota archaeon]|nr:MAG: hypothetical protein D6745_03580 [Candidatus Woesearchaeota archaeon]
MRAKIILLLFFLLLFTLASCGKSISREQAIQITQNFVNQNVKFHVGNNTVNKASINILSVLNKNKKWHLLLNVSSTQTGDKKSRLLSVSIDQRTGEIVDFKTLN